MSRFGGGPTAWPTHTCRRWATASLWYSLERRLRTSTVTGVPGGTNCDQSTARTPASSALKSLAGNCAARTSTRVALRSQTTLR